MAVFRINKTENYTVMSNEHLRDKNLTFKAKGLLSMMLSLPDNWDYSVAGLVAISVENETSVKSTLKELEDNGYLVRDRVQNSKGQFDYVYNIYEQPLGKKPQAENPPTDNPPMEKPQVENQGQLNTNNKILITNNDNDKAMQFYLQNINPLPVAREVEQIEQYQKELPQDLIIYGMEKAVDNKARNLAYIKAIWNKWIQRGITTLAEAQEEKPKVEKREDPAKQDYRIRTDNEIDYTQFYANF